MSIYRMLYFCMFRAAADAVEALEAQNYGLARDILIRAQQEAEEAYLQQAEKEPRGAL